MACLLAENSAAGHSRSTGLQRQTLRLGAQGGCRLLSPRSFYYIPIGAQRSPQSRRDSDVTGLWLICSFFTQHEPQRLAKHTESWTTEMVEVCSRHVHGHM